MFSFYPFTQSNAKTKVWERVCLSKRTVKPTENQADEEEHRTANRQLGKMADLVLN